MVSPNLELIYRGGSGSLMVKSLISCGSRDGKGASCCGLEIALGGKGKGKQKVEGFHSVGERRRERERKRISGQESQEQSEAGADGPSKQDWIRD